MVLNNDDILKCVLSMANKCTIQYFTGLWLNGRSRLRETDKSNNKSGDGHSFYFI